MLRYHAFSALESFQLSTNGSAFAASSAFPRLLVRDGSTHAFAKPMVSSPSAAAAPAFARIRSRDSLLLARIARNSSYVSAQPGCVRRGVRFRTLPKWVKATTYELCCCTVRGQRAVVSRSGVRGMNPEKLGEAAKNEAILLNSAPRRAGYEAPFVRALNPMR